jgi:hypothetical protein
LFIYFCCVVYGNKTISDEDNNNGKGKGKGKSKWKLVSEYENIEQPRQGMMFSSIDELFSYFRWFGWKSGFRVVKKKVTRDKITRESIHANVSPLHVGVKASHNPRQVSQILQ